MPPYFVWVSINGVSCCQVWNFENINAETGKERESLKKIAITEEEAEMYSLDQLAEKYPMNEE